QQQPPSSPEPQQEPPQQQPGPFAIEPRQNGLTCPLGQIQEKWGRPASGDMTAASQTGTTQSLLPKNLIPVFSRMDLAPSTSAGCRKRDGRNAAVFPGADHFGGVSAALAFSSLTLASVFSGSARAFF